MSEQSGFCPHCGAKIAATNPQPGPSPQAAAPVPSVQGSKSGGQRWRIASWFFGGLFFFAGLGGLLSGDFIPAIAILVIVGLLLPPVRDWTYRKTGRRLPLWARTLSIVSLMIIVGRSTESTENTPPASRREAAVESPSWIGPERSRARSRSAPQPTAASTPEEGQAAREETEQEKAEQKRPKVHTEFGSGTHLVGKDIQPGTYRTEVKAGLFGICYWERLAGLSGGFEDIIANDAVGEGSVIVTIAATDAAFKSQGCGQWKRVER